MRAEASWPKVEASRAGARRGDGGGPTLGGPALAGQHHPARPLDVSGIMTIGTAAFDALGVAAAPGMRLPGTSVVPTADSRQPRSAMVY